MNRGLRIGSGSRLGELGAFGVKGGANPPISQPDSAFSFLPFQIYKDGSTFNVGSWDISTQVPRTIIRYVNKSGNDSTGDGLSVGTAWKTLTKAWTSLATGTNAAVYVGAGRYGWHDGGFQDTITGITGRSLIATGDVVIDAFLTGTSSFSVTTGTVYQCNQNNPIDAILDFGTLDANGDPTAYISVTGVANVLASAGSFWKDIAVLYIHTLDETTPDADVRPQYSGQRCPRTSVNNITTYWEGIKFYHCAPTLAAVGANSTAVIYFNNCRFVHQANGKTITLSGQTAFLQNCQYAHIQADGVFGDAVAGTVSKIVEIDCKGWDIGKVVDTTSNATTNHNGGTNVIINGEYYNCYGANIAYIGNGKAWLLGVNSHDCNIGSGTLDDNYQFQETAWLDTCISSGSTYDISNNGTTYIHNFTGGGQYTGGGTVTTY